LDKPYFDNNGVIWLKTGADKRRVNTKEELRRFFQVTEQFSADELPTRGTIRDLDMLRRSPQRYQPQFTLKAVSFPGEDIHPTTCLDSEDFEGPLPAIFEGAMAFVVRNLHKIQGTGGVNAPGRPEIEFVDDRERNQFCAVVPPAGVAGRCRRRTNPYATTGTG
ncbi:MAG: hypothetical protein ACOC2V_05425, partial [Alkalispirochaeta sp.]